MTSTAKEYGAALFQWAQETDTVAAVATDLSAVTAAFTAQPEYAEFLACPSLPKTERIDAVRAAFGGKVTEQVTEFLCLLIENGRIRETVDCAAAFDELYRESQRIAQAQVITPVPLTAQQRADLTAALSKKTGRTVTLSCTVDESLLGGVVVELDGKRYDGSVKRRLQVIKEVIQ